MDEDKVIGKLIGHDDRLQRIEDDMVVVKEKVSLIDDLLLGQDKMMKILLRVDQERVFTNEKIKQLEADVKQIKLHLQIA